MLKKYLFLLLFILLMGWVRVGSSFAQQNMTLLGTLPYTPELSDIWGYVDQAGNEYALVGVNNTVSVVDISDPANPTEVFTAPGASSTWRDIKTWNDHAYITNESSGGLMIIDLSTLPSNPVLTVTNYTGGGLSSAHNIFIDENGYAYIFGSNITGGAVILDLNIDPMAPVQVGVFSSFYIHDGMVKGDTLWASHSSNGFFSAIDVSDKANPVIFNAGAATHSTGPPTLTHNCWISDDNNTLYTTDEQGGAFIEAYDVSDLANITRIGKVQSNPGSGVIPHNTHFMNGYLITSYYRDGVTIHDVSRPGIMIEVGNYDTSPSSGNGFNGAWGVYPWLPSGNVIVSDIENGLFVLGATYIRACYLEGTVTDFNTSNPINNATIEILTTSNTASSDINGDYAIGILTAGTYDIAFSAAGYIPDTLSAILSNGVLTVLNAQLVELIPFAISGQVIESGSGNPVPNANVKLESNDFLFNLTADGSGNFSIPVFYEGNYEVIAGKWNYITNCFNQYIDSNTSVILIELDSGVYDDFTFDFSWSVTGNAFTGIWERGEPVGTDWFSTGDANPGVDVLTDCSNQAYVTGNAGGGVGNDDVDNGNTVLTSPVFDLSSYTEPYISYFRWFFNDGGSGTPNDTLKVRLANGVTTVTIETVNEASPNNSSWVYRSFKISDYLVPTSTMQMMLETSDMPGSGHLVEAGVDKFQVTEYAVVIDSSNVMCKGACDGVAIASVNGGAQPLSYFWDDSFNQTTSTATGLCAGTYTVTVVDANNDTVYATVIIGEPTALTASLDSITNVSCNGGLDGIIYVSAIGGTPSYDFSIDGGISFQSNSVFTGLSAAGSYDIIARDANGCTDTIFNQIVSEPPALTADSTTITLASCSIADGSITIYVSGGTLPLEFSIDTGNTFQSNNTFDSLAAGIYSIIIRDSFNCITNTIATVSNAGAPSIMVDSVSDVSCNGGNDGIIYLSSISGNPPYQYSINGGAFQADSIFTGLTGGSYLLTVKDASSCESSILQSVAEPAALVFAIDSITNVSCNGVSDGTIYTSAAGGTSPYDFSIDNGVSYQSNSMFSGLSALSYNIIARDANGCTDTIFNQTISEPDSLAGTMSSTDESSSGANNGTASVSMSGGTGPYTYSWSPGSQTTPSISGLTSDVYTVTVTDSNGCTFVDSISVGTSIGINQYAIISNQLKVYPNPFNESTQIEYQLYYDISTDAKLLITDLLGRFVNEIALTSKQGTVTIGDEISKGVYFLRIINGKKFSHTVKLIKF